MLTEAEVQECLDYILSCQMAYNYISNHFRYPPSKAERCPDGRLGFGVSLMSMTKEAIAHAKRDWSVNFRDKECVPAWCSTSRDDYLEQLIDLIIENKERFQ